MSFTPIWLALAREDIGLRELPGAPTEPRISVWLKRLGAWWRDDETPWCGTAVAAWMVASGVKPSRAWYRAKDWLNWGAPLDNPVEGCVVIFGREGGGHVGIVAGQDDRGRLMVLGGNQGNAVSIAPFERGRVLGYRWPLEYIAMLDAGSALPRFASSGASSTNEA